MMVEPLHTKVEKAIQTNIGLVVLENPDDFPSNQSNLYCLKENGELVWQAEIPAPQAHYTRVRLNDSEFSLSAYATTGHACEIDLSTGKIIRLFGIK